MAVRSGPESLILCGLLSCPVRGVPLPSAGFVVNFVVKLGSGFAVCRAALRRRFSLPCLFGLAPARCAVAKPSPRGEVWHPARRVVAVVDRLIGADHGGEVRGKDTEERSPAVERPRSVSPMLAAAAVA